MAPVQPIVERKIFQNAQNFVEVTVRSKSAAVKPPKKSNFKRNCVLKAKLDCGKDNFEANKKMAVKRVNSKEPEKKKDPTTKSKKSHILPENCTWAEFLAKYLENSVANESDLSYSESSCYSSVLSGQKYCSEKVKKSSQATNASEKPKSLSENISKRNVPSNKSKSDVKTAYTQTGTALCNGRFRNNPQQFSSPQKDKANFGSESTEQTPFSNSALQLLRKLRQRLLSKGDSESTDMVNKIQAIFDLPKSFNPDNQRTPDSASVFFPSDDHGTTKAEDKKTIKMQAATIENLEKQLIELRTISSDLLKFHEQTQKPIPESMKENPEKGPSSYETHQMLKKTFESEKQALLVERDALLAELNRNRRFILSLDAKLRQAYKELNHQKSFAYSVPSRPQSQMSTKTDRPLETDDSAFDEKTSSKVDSGIDVRNVQLNLQNISSLKMSKNYENNVSLVDKLSLANFSVPSDVSEVSIDKIHSNLSQMSLNNSLNDSLLNTIDHSFKTLIPKFGAT